MIDALQWDIPASAKRIEDISFEWTPEEFGETSLQKTLIDGGMWQIQSLHADQPWGIFLQCAFHTGAIGYVGPVRNIKKVRRTVM